MSRGIVLFAHGARDPEWARPLERLSALVAARDTGAQVRCAFLEHMQPPLEAAVETLLASGANEITVIPVFIAQGGHLKTDLPLIVEAIRAAHPQLAIRLAPPVGESAAVLNAMADYALGDA